MGPDSAPTGDAEDFFPFYDSFINPTMWATRSLNYQLSQVPATICEPALACLRQGLTDFRRKFAQSVALWGVKGPRSMYMLPFWHQMLPGLTFLHVIRDGRDMAISDNLAQVERHYAAVFGESPGTDLAIAAARLWAKANTEAKAWCRENIPDRYLQVRYEDLSAQPVRTIVEILDFLSWNHSPSVCAQLAGIIKPAAGIGRWRSLPSNRQSAIAAAAQPALEYFGYATAGFGSTQWSPSQG
jgi:hypothetical protein